jgi:Tfp pilus assembly protein PilN
MHSDAHHHPALHEPPTTDRRADPRLVIPIEERRPTPSGGRRARLAMAAGPDRLTVVRLGGGVLGRTRVEEVLRYPLAAADGAALEEGLRGLAAELGAGGGVLDVALLRRMAHAKVVPLPPVRRAELGALLRRNARRHFAVRDEPLVADALRMPGPRHGPLAPALAACAPAAMVQAIADAAEGAGFGIGRMVPAAVALAEAVRARVPRARRGRIAAVACVPGAPELVLLENGAVRLVQPLPASADPVLLARSIAAAVREGAESGVVVDALLVLGDAGDGADAVRFALDAEGDAPPQLMDRGLDGLPAEAVLALGAAVARESAPSLLPEPLVRERARAARRRTVFLAAAASVLLLIAAAAHLSGVRAEVESVRARRAQIAPQVRKALDSRTGVTELRERLRVLSALEAQAPAWTAQMAALARALPDSAWLRTLTADSAGVRMSGVARSVSTVIPALEASPRFDHVGLAAPIRWEAGDTGERFEVSASLQSARSAAPKAAPARAPEVKP